MASEFKNVGGGGGAGNAFAGLDEEISSSSTSSTSSSGDSKATNPVEYISVFLLGYFFLSCFKEFSAHSLT